MARIARLVVPGLPHHVTQRGNGRNRTFFQDSDYRLYLDLFAEAAARARLEVWAYCLMPNHVHAIVVPANEDGLRRGFAELHRRYTSFVNARARRTGHLWQGRFGSAPMDERHLMNAFRYVSLNPVRAGLAARAQDWPWSSARAHLSGRDDGLVRVAPGLERAGDFAAFLDQAFDEAADYAPLRKAEGVGRPLGPADWIEQLETQTGRTLAPRKRGPKAGARDGEGDGLSLGI